MMDINTLARLASEDKSCRVCLNLPSALIAMDAPRWKEALLQILSETPGEVKEQIFVGIQKNSKEILKQACKEMADGLISNGHLDVYYTALNWAEP